MDFICKPNSKGKMIPRVNRVDYDIDTVQKNVVWKGVIQADSKWAYAKERSYKRALKDALEKEDFYRKEASALRSYIRSNFAVEKIYSDFVDNIWKPSESEIQDMEDAALADSSMFAALGNLQT